MNIHLITFSPTGGTRRVSESLCKALSDESVVTELCTKPQNLSYPDITADDEAEATASGEKSPFAPGPPGKKKK